MGANSFSVVWEGFVKADQTGTYTFGTRSDDGVRLWVGDLNTPLIDNWTNHPPTWNRASIELEAGQLYPIQLKYYENGGGAVIELYWTRPGQAEEIIPSSHLFVEDEEATATQYCAGAAEHSKQDAELQCPSGQTIETIEFASYGTPTGACDQGFETSTCHAAGSVDVVEGLCLNQSSCTVDAANSLFGDPCRGTPKYLRITYTCSGEEGEDDNGPGDGGGDDDPPPGGANIVQHTQDVDLGRPIASTRRWTYRTSGRCGLKCRNGPRQMYSASFGDTYLLSWMAVDETLPAEPGEGWVHYGNVSTFTVSNNGEFTLEDDVSFQGACEAIYGMTTNNDGSVIAVLCKGYAGAELLPGTENLLATQQGPDCDPATNAGCYPIGTYNPAGSGLYIFEFTAAPGTPAQITTSPDRVILVNHALGGANYGHHEILLNSAEDTYFLALKVTNNTGQHQGLKHFGVRRTPDLEYVRLTDYNGWACGGGHIMANRMAYNEAHDSWSLLCTNDLCTENKQYVSWRCHNVAWSFVPGVSHHGVEGAATYHEGEELLSFETNHQLPWESPGGTAAIVSLGDDGWLALAPQLSPSSPAEEQMTMARSLGLINLPVEARDLFDRRIPEEVPIYGTRFDATPTGRAEVNRYEWNRVFDYEPGAAEHARFGSANVAYFSTEGEASERLLLGWSPDIAFQGITSDFVVSEIDRQGRLRGDPLVLDRTGWGEDNRWVTIPDSGCVVFPFAWTGDGGPGNSYPIHDADFSAYPTTMHLTSLCPGTENQPPIQTNPSPWGPTQ
jgi:hypothetical protein